MSGTRTLIIIAYWDGHPHQDLSRLLMQLDPEARRCGIDICVVVNSMAEEPVPLPRVSSKVALLYRENSGMNIGAWEHGWRTLSGYDHYIFLQSECVVLQSGWPEAYAAALYDMSAGLIGETIAWHQPWQEILELPKFGARFAGYLRQLTAWGIAAGETAQHVQSLIWASRREVLDAIGGFPIGASRDTCIAAEIGVSRKVEAAGLRLRLVGSRRFQFISHPQWDHRARAMAV